jgi:hypothetical protein
VSRENLLRMLIDAMAIAVHAKHLAKCGLAPFNKRRSRGPQAPHEVLAAMPMHTIDSERGPKCKKTHLGPDKMLQT